MTYRTVAEKIEYYQAHGHNEARHRELCNGNLDSYNPKLRYGSPNHEEFLNLVDAMRGKRYQEAGLVPLLTSLNTAKQAYDGLAKNVLHQFIKGIFSKFPSVQRLVWTQHPHYDDETTEFSFMGLNKCGSEDCDEDDDADYDSIGDKADLDSIDSALYAIPLEAMEAAFGSSSRVVCTPDKITVENYDGE
jgi:hypothetical protein